MREIKNLMSREQMIAQWEQFPAKAFMFYVELPCVEYAPSYLMQAFGDMPDIEDLNNQVGREFQALEDQHPELKGQMTTWKVLRVEVYPGADDCAYDAMVVCYCDRVRQIN